MKSDKIISDNSPTLKLITWNCNMAFRNKAKHLQSYHPDIAVIPECEHPDKLSFTKGTRLPSDVLWVGDNMNKGLGIFSFSKYKFKMLDIHNPEFKMILPISVSDGDNRFILFGVWANNPADKPFQYIGQVWKALQYYNHLLTERVILLGDFNSNTIWDKPRREGNHSTVVKFLEEKKIYSSYHQYFAQIQGKEKHHTLFMYRHHDKPYHIDYCFASEYFNNKIKKVAVGKYERWKAYSDHTPVMVTFSV